MLSKMVIASICILFYCILLCCCVCVCSVVVDFVFEFYFQCELVAAYSANNAYTVISKWKWNVFFKVLSFVNGYVMVAILGIVIG